MKYLILLMLCIVSFGLMAQTGGQATLQGNVTNEKGKPLELVNVSILGLPGGTATDQRGDYTLRVPADENLRIIFSFIGFESLEKKARRKPDNKCCPRAIGRDAPRHYHTR
jgi:hypothetical protein